MQLKNYPFDKLPFTELYQTYISEFEQLAEFYSVNPFDQDTLASHADIITVPQDREEMAELLTVFNNRFNLHGEALNNIERLKDDRSLALVTGQQLGVFGGPLFTILKTITTIHLSNVLEERLNCLLYRFFGLRMRTMIMRKSRVCNCWIVTKYSPFGWSTILSHIHRLQS